VSKQARSRRECRRHDPLVASCDGASVDTHRCARAGGFYVDPPGPDRMVRALWRSTSWDARCPQSFLFVLQASAVVTVEKDLYFPGDVLRMRMCLHGLGGYAASHARG
jgi:hypothetical protein